MVHRCLVLDPLGVKHIVVQGRRHLLRLGKRYHFIPLALPLVHPVALQAMLHPQALHLHSQMHLVVMPLLEDFRHLLLVVIRQLVEAIHPTISHHLLFRTTIQLVVMPLRLRVARAFRDLLLTVRRLGHHRAFRRHLVPHLGKATLHQVVIISSTAAEDGNIVLETLIRN